MKLILKEDSWTNATAFFLEDLYREHFELTTDLSSDGIVYSHWQDWEWAKSLNRPAIIDHLWDPWENPEIQDTEYLKVIRSDGWFAIANECLWYQELGYHTYQPELQKNKTFLMPMNLQKEHRDQIWSAIQPHLGRAVYSYVAHGIQLPYDINAERGDWQRYINPDWFDRTMYSLVVESGIDNNPMIHSEKILKPIAFQHPFIVWGPCRYLEWLKTWGFETFDNIIDESYDLEPDPKLRLEMVIKEVARLNQQPSEYFDGPETLKRIDNNFNRFYNVDWAIEQFEKYFDTIKQYSNSW